MTFQRDERNALLLDRIGYRLPSLSAGDRVKLNGVAYCCEPVGFKPDWRDPHQPLNPWPIGASDG